MKASGLCVALCLGGLALAEEPMPAVPTEDGELPTGVVGEHIGDSLFESGSLGDHRMDALAAAEAELHGRAQPGAGRWKVAPHLDLKAAWDDNIFIQPRDEQADTILIASPGLAFGFWDSSERFESWLYRDKRASRDDRSSGNFAVFDYTLALVKFTDHDSEDSVDHDAAFDAQWTSSKLTLGARFRFKDGTNADVDIGGRVRRRVSTAVAEAKYEVSERVSVQTSVEFTRSEPEGFTNATEVRSESWFNYLLTPQISTGLGAAFGHVSVEDAPGDTYQQVLARAGYTATEKVSFRASGGVEFRQSDSSGGDETTPVFEVRFAYEPTEKTKAYVEAYRRISNSALEAGRDYLTTGVSARVRHQLWPGVFLMCDGGYEEADYAETVRGANRRDQYFYVRPGVQWNFAPWGNAQLTYQHRENESTFDSNTFANNQVELQISLSF